MCAHTVGILTRCFDGITSLLRGSIMLVKYLWWWNEREIIVSHRMFHDSPIFLTTWTRFLFFFFSLLFRCESTRAPLPPPSLQITFRRWGAFRDEISILVWHLDFRRISRQPCLAFIQTNFFTNCRICILSDMFFRPRCKFKIAFKRCETRINWSE